ncbi:MAG: filament integrity protein FraC [Geitlerinemataceae cyanobacterium]
MFSILFPLKTLFLQTLLLVATIAIESWVFQQRLALPRRLSIIYATAINFMAVAIGWLFFFSVQPAFLPPGIKTQLISYVCLGKLSNSSLAQGVELWIVLLIFGIFVVTWQVKVQSLYAMQMSQFIPSRFVRGNTVLQRRERLIVIREQSLTVLVAHGISNSLVLGVLILVNLPILR